ncbi:MAG: Mut7-C RNAse domain-containing protein [Chloroflexi bacterium]|nr:Mut7-C RNAse domain-containing protein [Chloroflexota bacterium]
MGEIRFLADSMLGTLAKWLRILGYDTLYFPDLTDLEAVRLARSEGRVLLTRDTGLLRRKGFRALFVRSEVLEEQLAQVLREFGLHSDHPFSRCPVCNTELEDVPKYEAWGQVPPFVFQTQESFRLCPECNRFYWRGTHWQKMRAQLEKLAR